MKFDMFRKLTATACAMLLIGPAVADSQDLTILGTENGNLVWATTNAGNVTIEWTHDLVSPNWRSDWDSLKNITSTGTVMSAEVPVFMRARHIPGTTEDLLSSSNMVAVQAIVDAAVTNYNIPGISYAIKYYGRDAYLGTSGAKNLTPPFDDIIRNEAMTSDCKFRVGSASKTFAAMSIHKLAKEQQLWYDMSITNMLPDITNMLSNYDCSGITIRQLVQHTSGLATYTSYDDWALEYIFNRSKVWAETNILDLINFGNDVSNTNPGSYPPQSFTPGYAWEYSNTGYYLIGMVVEAITGTNFPQYVSDTFLTPLGLTNTVYPTSGETTIPGTFASGYINWADFFQLGFLPTNILDVTDYDTTGVGAAGAMISTPEDLCRWLEAIETDAIGLGDYNPARQPWRQWMTSKPKSGGWVGGLTVFGLGLAHESDPNNNADYSSYAHRGQISGYDTAMLTIPSKGVSLSLICNRSLENGGPGNAAEVALYDVVAELFPDLIADNQL